MHEIARNNKNEIVCDVVYDYIGESKKKLQAELESMGVFKRIS